MEHIDLSTAVAIFGLAFGAWAFVVAWGVGVIKKEVVELKELARSTQEKHEQHVNQTERRLTMLETEFGYLRRKTDHISTHMES